MSKVSYGEDFSYASSRLNGTIVRLPSGNPFLVDSVSGHGVVSGTDLYSGAYATSPLGELNLTPIKLGLVNSKSGVGLALRTPSRYYKQGLAKRNLKFTPITKSCVRAVNVMDPALVKTMMGIFPKVVSCLESLLNDERESVAFSRDFFLSKRKNSVVLHYRKHQVGFCEYEKAGGGNPNLVLHDKYQHLTEVLEESLQNA